MHHSQKPLIPSSESLHLVSTKSRNSCPWVYYVSMLLFLLSLDNCQQWPQPQGQPVSSACLGYALSKVQRLPHKPCLGFLEGILECWARLGSEIMLDSSAENRCSQQPALLNILLSTYGLQSLYLPLSLGAGQECDHCNAKSPNLPLSK